MDNITHTLVGMALVRAGVGRRTPGAMAVMLMATNAPDSDIVTAFTGGAVPYLEAHRGWTHGPLGVAACGVAAAVIVWLVQRQRAAGAAEHRSTLAALAVIGLVGAALHVLMDLPTSYGTRALAPFDDTWFAFDWLPIIDVYIWAMLFAGLAAARMAPARRVTIARTVLAGVLSFYVLRGVAHGQALDRAAETAADGTASPCATAPVLTRHPDPEVALEAERGTAPQRCLQAAAIPTFLSPFRWTLIRRHAEGYELRDTSLIAAHAGGSLWIATEPQHALAAARQAEAARVFLAFSRMPAVDTTVLADGSRRVRFVDVRFLAGPVGLPQEPRARAPFVATVVLSPAGAVVQQRLGD